MSQITSILKLSMSFTNFNIKFILLRSHYREKFQLLRKIMVHNSNEKIEKR